MQELYPKQREEGIQGWLDSTYGKLVTAVRKAMDEIEPQREAKRGGNTRPLWAPILAEVEWEKALITGMLRGARAFLKNVKACSAPIPRAPMGANGGALEKKGRY